MQNLQRTIFVFTLKDNQCPFTFWACPLKAQDCTYLFGIDYTHYTIPFVDYFATLELNPNCLVIFFSRIQVSCINIIPIR